MAPWLTIVGIGEDGLEGLGARAREALASARTLIGGRRHLALVPERGEERIAWPSPLAAGIELLLARRGTPVCVLASGDPMWFGIGASLSKLVPADELIAYPAPSAFALAAARLGWPLQETALLSVHGRPVEALHPHVHPERHLLILSENGETPAAVARLLRERGFGKSRLSVFAQMGGPKEARLSGSAARWPHGRCADLNLVAVECLADADAARLSTLAGLPDSAYRNDGQLTKRDVRAAVLARLAPSPGELLWDIGAGCGSIGIEWMRSHPSCRAIAIEAEAARCGFIEENKKRLGVPDLRIVQGRAPRALEALEQPHAIFVGGGLTEAGLLERAWEALAPGGRFVANAVTLESEAVLAAWHGRTSGELTRLSLAHAEPLGRLTGWRAAMPVAILSARKR